MINARKRKRNILFSSNSNHITEDHTQTQRRLSVTGQATSLNLAAAPEDVSGRRVYVVGVGRNAAAFKLLEHFRMYGEVEEGPVGYDLGADSSTGYAVFLYKTKAGAAAALLDPVKIVDGKYLYCKGH